MDAQRAAVAARLNGGPWQLVGKFTEVESGKQSKRPQLVAALAACKKQKAKLFVAKLDRLSRNTRFLLTLIESGVEVLFADLPDVTGAMGKFILTQMAAVAELEAGLIGERTKAALAAAKARGVVLGNPRLADVRDRAVANLKADADRFAKNVAPIIREIQSTGVASHRGIARSLNSRGIATARGGEWTAVQVGSILRRSHR